MRSISVRAREIDWPARLRLLAIPTICAFLSFVFVVVRPWARISGQWAFLVYTSNLIFFFPRGHIGAQAEATVLGVLGGTLGIAWSTATLAVAAYCGRTYGSDSSQARAILGLGLAILSAIAGLVRSYSRRLNAFSKIILFFPIFMLTDQQAITRVRAAFFLEQFYVVVFSAVFALLPTLLLAPRRSSNRLGVEINNSIETICALLPLSVSNLLDADPLSVQKTSSPTSHVDSAKTLEAQVQPRPVADQDKLAQKLKGIVAELHISSSIYVKDSRLLENQSKSLLTVIKSLQRLQRNPLLGQTSHAPGERIQAALQRSFPHPRSRPPSTHSTVASNGPQPQKRRSFTVSRPGRHASVSPGADHGSTASTWPRHKLHHLTSNFGPPSESHKSLPLPVVSQPNLRDASGRLVDAIVDALGAVDTQLATKFRWPKPQISRERKASDDKDHDGLIAARERLEDMLSDVQHALGTLLSGSKDGNQFERDSQQRGSGEEPDRRLSTASEVPMTPPHHVTFTEATDVTSLLRNKDRFRLAFYMTSLLDLARDVHSITNTVILAAEEEMTASSWLAFLRLRWMRYNKDDDEGVGGNPGPAETDIVADEDQPHDQTKEYQDMDFVTATLHQQRAPATSSSDRIARAWRRVWDKPGVVRARVMVSRTNHQIKHSRHVLFALKLTIGISLLALPALLDPNHPGRKWYDKSRGGWMVVSYMFVLEDTTGAILKVGFLRGAGCLIGAVAGFVCAVIAQGNPYALVVLATACTIPISWHILFNTSTPGLGVSTGITLPPLMFITYLGYANGQSDFELAWYRFTDIIIGTAAAVIFGTAVWPVHARVQYFRAVSGTMERITEFYLRMSRDLVRSSLVYRVNDKQYDELEGKIKRDFALSRTLVSIQRQEISLLPRPIRLYSEIIDASERLLETLVEIRMLRFSVPRKATVLDVLPIRRELISTILINLWACGHAFASRSPLPQFLPSPRSPLAELMEVTDQHARDIKAFRHAYAYPDDREERGRGMDRGPSRSDSPAPASGQSTPASYQAEMAILYAMAENEALGEVCNILEEIVAAAKTLFGSQSFLDAS
ncbi:hypothetical protein IAU60_005556 [Kwoniella sp. DSM 27419]